LAQEFLKQVFAASVLFAKDVFTTKLMKGDLRMRIMGLKLVSVKK